MNDQSIKHLAEKYRTALEIAHRDGRFSKDFCFNHFPRGCCGDTCYLLAEYLRIEKIETIWYSAQRDDWSHAWLVVKDSRIRVPTPNSFSWPKELQFVIAGYGIQQPEKEISITHYSESDLENGLIIDITGDQFDDCNDSVFVNTADCFHKTFHFNQAHDYKGLCDQRLRGLYYITQDYL